MTTVGLLGFGEVGQTLANQFAQRPGLRLGACDRLFDQRDSAPSLAAQSHGGLASSTSAATALADCELIVSAVTASECLNAAQAAAASLRPGAWFVDLNSVSPGTTQRAAEVIENAGGRYVECAVMSPIQPHGAASPMLLGGPHAQAFLDARTPLVLSNTTVISATLGQASAAKMCRSVMIKGMEALVSEALLGARYFGVESVVLESMGNQFPSVDWRNHARYLIGRTVQHGARRAEEMREVGVTLREAGVDPLMTLACVERQARAPSYTDAAQHDELENLLDAMLTRVAAHGDRPNAQEPNDAHN